MQVLRFIVTILLLLAPLSHGWAAQTRARARIVQNQTQDRPARPLRNLPRRRGLNQRQTTGVNPRFFDQLLKMPAAERQQFLREHPPPKFQFWMQDLYVAVFLYGSSMIFVLWQIGDAPEQYKESTTLAFVFYLLLVQGFAVYAAFDAMRRCAPPLTAKRRIVFLTIVMLYSSFLSVFTWLAWRSWRYALRHSGWVLGADLQEKQRADQMGADASAPSPAMPPA